MPSLQSEDGRAVDSAAPLLMCGDLKKCDDSREWVDVYVELREHSITCYSASDKIKLLVAFCIDANTQLSTSSNDTDQVLTIFHTDKHLKLAIDSGDKRRKWIETIEACCLKAQIMGRTAASLSTPTTSDKAQNGKAQHMTPSSLSTPATHFIHEVAALQREARSRDDGGPVFFFTPPTITPAHVPQGLCGEDENDGDAWGENWHRVQRREPELGKGTYFFIMPNLLPTQYPHSRQCQYFCTGKCVSIRHPHLRRCH
jgi:hypothetical protein